MVSKSSYEAWFSSKESPLPLARRVSIVRGFGVAQRQKM